MVKDASQPQARASQPQARVAVFDRVQMPHEGADCRPLLRDLSDINYQARYVTGSTRDAGSRMDNVSPRKHQNMLSYQNRDSFHHHNNSHRTLHADRLMRRRDDRNLGVNRHAPYGRKSEMEWRKKRRYQARSPAKSDSRYIVPCEHGSKAQENKKENASGRMESSQLYHDEETR